MPENRETSDTFSARAVQWWNRVVQRQESLHKNSQEFEDERTQPVNILITTHGGLIVTLTQNLLGSRKIRCEDGVKVGKCLNASISIIEMEKGGKGVLVKYSDAAHLDANVVEVNVDVIGVSSS